MKIIKQQQINKTDIQYTGSVFSFLQINMSSMSGFRMPPGGAMDILFSFDTTGSMSYILEEVKGRLSDMIQRLQADIPGIRIGVIAHGDYCDEEVFYLEKHIDFTQNVAELCQFVGEVEGTGGGDQDECYELILRKANEEFTWAPVSNKVLVMIGDANPHEPDYKLNVDRINWRDEVSLLAKQVRTETTFPSKMSKDLKFKKNKKNQVRRIFVNL